MSNNQPNLYALLVGINNYQHHPNAQLDGCENDVNNIANLLKEPFMANQFGNGTEGVVKLIDKDATKENIIKQFREHLGKAKKGDTAMFYFSGHGIREETVIPAFKATELDGKIGALFCHDSELGNINHTEGTFLADKELRYLIGKLADQHPHIVVLADCCHSGDNTRNILNVDEQPKGKSRQIIKEAASNRAWEGFFFHKEIGEANAQLLLTKKHTLDKVIPQGNHIQMAACREFEEAYEEGGSGNFTRALIDIINSHQGDITYQELQSRIRNRMRVKSPDPARPDYKVQIPQIYVCSDDSNDKYKNFLTGNQHDKPVDAAVIFNESEKKWRINLGVIQAVPTDRKTQVEVFPKGIDPDKEKGKLIKAETLVSEVHAGHTLLAFPDGKEPAQGTAWMGRIRGLAIKPLNVFVSGDQDAVGKMLAFMGKAEQQGGSQYVIQCQTEDMADYVIRTQHGHYAITEPQDQRAIVEQIPVSESAPEVVYAFLVHIAKWAFLRDLEHDPESGGGSNGSLAQSTLKKPVELKVFQQLPDGSEIQLDVDRGKLEIDMTQDLTAMGENDEEPNTTIRMEITNHVDKELFCALIYQDHMYGISKVMLAPAESLEGLTPEDTAPDKKERFEVTLGKGETVSWILPAERDGNDVYPATNELPLYFKAFLIRDQWESFTEYVKLVVSAEINPPDLDLDQEGLPEPKLLGSAKSGSRSIKRKKKPETQPYKLPENYWSVKTLELNVINPHIKQSPHA